jgi:hypothetical protein
MQFASLTLRFGAFSRLATLAAVTTVFGCAASDTSGFDPGEGDTGVKTDAPATDTGGGADTAKPDTTPAKTDTAVADTGATCVSSCTSDDQCATSCPAAGTGSNCCDTATGVCYVSADSTCPSITPTDSGPPPPY